MTTTGAALADIDDPLVVPGWRVSRPDDEGMLHTEVLRELCDRGLALHVGAAGTRGVAATLQLVDTLRQQLVLASQVDGIALARVLQARPLWAAAHVHNLRVQFALSAPGAVREGTSSPAGRGERFLIQARWPREIYRTSRRRVARMPVDGGRAIRAPVARIHQGGPLVSARDLPVLDLGEGGCALLLPAGMVPPAPGSPLAGVELELDEGLVIVTDMVALHVQALGRRRHRVGCRWEDMAADDRRRLQRWLKAAPAPAPQDLLAAIE